MLTLKKILLPVILLCSSIYSLAQVKFTAGLNAEQISKDEYVEYRLSAENARQLQSVKLPSLNNFILISGPNEESSTTVMNGVMKSAVAKTFILKPKAPGNFTIGPATAVVDGKTFTSNAVSVKVNNTLAGRNGNTPSQANSLSSLFGGMDPFADAPQREAYNDYILRKGEDPTEKVKKNILIKVDVNKTSCYVGEPVIATYKLYTRLKSESSLTGNPSFNGFSVIDIQPGSNTSYTNERVNGREYNVYVIRKVQLYPLQSGTLTLEPVEVENNVRFIKEAYANQQRGAMSDIFGDLNDATVPAEGVQDEKIILKSTPLNITVKPLPETGKPASFKGAVGNFKILAAVEKNKFSTDDAGKLQILLSGEGNLQLVTNVEAQWPSGIDAFEPKSTDDINKNTVPVSGKKLIEYPFTVAKAGDYNLPPIEFSYFDPKAGQYKTITSQAINFSVSQGTGKPSADTLALIKENSNNKGFLNTIFSHRRWVISGVAVLILCGLIIWLKNDRKNEKKKKAFLEAERQEKIEEQQPAEEIIINQQNHLASAEESLYANDSKQFFVNLNQAFKNYLSQRLSIPQENLNKRTINEALDKKDISIDTSIQVNRLLDEMEFQLYTPFVETNTMHEMYSRASGLIQLLNTYKW